MLYSLTFMSLLAMVMAVFMRIGGLFGILASVILPAAAPVHMFFQLKGAYGLGIFSALWRTVFLMWRLRWRYWRGESPQSLAEAYR